MPASLHPDDLLRFAGALLTILSLILAARIALPETLRLRPPRRTPRCPGGYKRLLILPLRDHCWYDLSRVPPAPDRTIRCPECGRRNTRRRQRRRRRHWRRALLASPLLLLAYALYATPRIQAHGWPGALPTTALILAMPALHHILPPYSDWATADPRLTTIYQETARRLREPAMWHWQRSLAIELVPMGEKSWTEETFSMGGVPYPTGRVTPADECLIALQSAFSSRHLSTTETRRWLSRLLGEQPALRRGMVHTRAAWPAGEPIMVELRGAMRVLDARTFDAMIRARVRGSDAAWAEYMVIPRRDLGLPYRWLSPPRRTPSHAEVEIEILLGVRRNGATAEIDRSGAWLAWAGVARAIPIRPDPASQLRPVDRRPDHPALEVVLAQCTLVNLSDGDLALVWPMEARPRLPRGIDQFTVRCDLLLDSQVIATGAAMRLKASDPIENEPHGRTATRLRWVGPRLNNLAQSALQVRFRGDRNLAWGDLTADKYWAGDVTVPVTFDGSQRRSANEYLMTIDIPQSVDP